MTVDIPYGNGTYKIELSFFEYKLLQALSLSTGNSIARYVRESAVLFYQESNGIKSYRAQGDVPSDWRDEAYALEWAGYDTGEDPQTLIKQALIREWEMNPPLLEAGVVLRELHKSANDLMMMQLDQKHGPVVDADDTLKSEGIASSFQRYVELPFRPRLFFAPDIDNSKFFFMAPGWGPAELNHFVVIPAGESSEIEEGPLWFRRWMQSVENDEHEAWWEEVVALGEEQLAHMT